MTLLVGILCKDGIVIATDRQATLGTAGMSTVAQQVTKVRIVDDDCLYSTTGAVGLGQQLCAIVEAEHKKFRNASYASVAPKLQAALRALINPALETASLAGRVMGPQAAMPDALCGSLMAAQFSDGLRLVEISHQAGFEALTSDIPFSCMGSGKQNADPFLGFIWSVFFDKDAPTVQQGILAAYWTVQHGIKSKSAGVGFTPDVFVLEQKGKNAIARQLAKEELQEHDAFIDFAISGMRAASARVASGDSTPSAQSAPQPAPTPPPDLMPDGAIASAGPLHPT